jgi:DNA replication protein DnaC
MRSQKSAPVDGDSDGTLTRIDAISDQPALALDARSTALPPSHTLVVQAVCGICKGAGWFKEAVPFGHPHFGLLFPCECKQAEQARRTAEELARLSNLDSVRDKTFATFSPFIPGLRDVISHIRCYAKRPEGWLTLLGPYGSGKTHLAAAIAHEAHARGEPVLFTVVPDLLDHLRATFGPQSTVGYDERFELVRTVSLLILDDLGTESATPWAREKLYQLMNHRYNYRLATIITTNLKPEAIEPRIYSRLCDPSCGKIIMMMAPDYRRRLARKDV